MHLKKEINLLLLVITVVFISCENQREYWELSDDVGADVEHFLKEGLYECEMLTEARSDREVLLTEKLRLTMGENPLWFQNYVKSLDLAPGEPLPYHRNFELTEEEYEELLGYYKNIEFVPAAEIYLETVSLDSKIDIFPSVTNHFVRAQIDLKNNEVLINSIKLPFADTVRINDNNNPFKSSWHGYRWNLKSSDIDLNHALTDTIFDYSFTLGQFHDSNKMYVQISATKAVEGFKLLDYRYILREKVFIEGVD